MEWTLVDITAVLCSGLIGALASAVIVCYFNLREQNRREKRRALRGYFSRFRYQRANRDFELLNEVYVSFSDSPEVLRRLVALRDEDGGRGHPQARKELVAAMCESSGVKYNEFLYGNDIGISGKS